jgi:hypothetical protein
MWARRKKLKPKPKPSESRSEEKGAIYAAKDASFEGVELKSSEEGFTVVGSPVFVIKRSIHKMPPFTLHSSQNSRPL